MSDLKYKKKILNERNKWKIKNIGSADENK
jgi:hypothetical protein